MCGSDARQRGRHREAEIFVGAEFGVAQRAVQRRGQQRPRHLDRHAAAGAVFAAGPAGVDQPAIDIVLGDQVAQHDCRTTDGSRGRNGEPKQVENSGCGSLPRPRSVPATFAV